MITSMFFPVELSSLDATTITNTYQAISTGFARPVSFLRIINTSDVSVMISYDGVNDHDVVLDDSDLSINAQVNNQPGNRSALFKVGTIIYVKYILGAGKSGDIHVTGYCS